MKKKKSYKIKSKPMVVNEPPAVSMEKRITFFSSFEEMNDDDHHYFSTLSYNERLSQLHSLLLRLYHSELQQNPTLGNRIFFD